jgi:hypothetical protein
MREISFEVNIFVLHLPGDSVENGNRFRVFLENVELLRKLFILGAQASKTAADTSSCVVVGVNELGRYSLSSILVSLHNLALRWSLILSLGLSTVLGNIEGTITVLNVLEHLFVQHLFITPRTNQPQYLDHISYSLMKINWCFPITANSAPPGSNLVLYTLPTVEHGAISIGALATLVHNGVTNLAHEMLVD